MTTIVCQHCGVEFQAQRRTRKFCSRTCANHSAWKVTKTRECRHCGQQFTVSGTGDANRQHCSKECAKNHHRKRIAGWRADNPDAMKRWNQSRVAKNPSARRDQGRTERERILKLLGGACAVCGVTKSCWLHVDFIPTTRELRFRHPRHFAYVSTHADLFRVLCANHHYELTLTGRIEGTDITQ